MEEKNLRHLFRGTWEKRVKNTLKSPLLAVLSKELFRWEYPKFPHILDFSVSVPNNKPQKEIDKRINTCNIYLFQIATFIYVIAYHKQIPQNWPVLVYRIVNKPIIHLNTTFTETIWRHSKRYPRNRQHYILRFTSLLSYHV